MVDLEDLKKDSTHPEMSQIATTFLDSYRFPVMMMIASPDGKVLHAVNANEFLDKDADTYETIFNMGFTDPTIANYVGFLKEGINLYEKARQQTREGIQPSN